MPLRIPAFREVLAQLSGDPIYTKAIAVSPGAGGIAFDGTYFYLNYYQGAEIYVVNTAGTLVSTLSLADNYYDIDYDPLTDTLWAVDPTVTGIDKLSKSDGSLIENMQSALINDQYTSIAIDRDNDRLYLLFHDLYTLFVLRASTLATLIRTIYFPYFELGQPSSLMVAIDGEDRERFWVGFKSFPVMLSRVDKDTDKISAYRLLGVSFDQVKSSISMRFVNDKWYYWGNWGTLDRANLYEISGMPTPTAAYVQPSFPEFDQDVYRWYEDDDAENPTPKAAEDTEITNVDFNDILRLRLGFLELLGSSVPWTQGITIQYAEAPAGPWMDVAAIGAIDEAFRFYDGAGLNGAIIANLLLSNTTIKEFFVESAPSNFGLTYRNPDRGEFDVCVQAIAPLPLQDYYFKAVCRDGLIKNYSAYPKLTSVDYPTLRFSLREHKSYAAYTSVITFSKPDISQLRMTTSTVALGDGYFFIVADRAWLDNKYVRFRWRSNIPSTLTCDVIIHDGEYVRSSDVDFPPGTGKLVKGNGLLQTMSSKSAPFAWETLDVQAAVAGGSETKCTIFFLLHDNQSGAGAYLDLDWLEVNDSPGGADPLYSEQFMSAITMEREGTVGDYGYISSGDLPQ